MANIDEYGVWRGMRIRKSSSGVVNNITEYNNIILNADNNKNPVIYRIKLYVRSVNYVCQNIIHII